jgi:hypothetical protein
VVHARSGVPESLRRSPGYWQPVRPVEVGVISSTVEEIYLASIRGDLPPADYRERPDWAVEANARSFTLRLASVRMGSPLHLVIDLPSLLYVPTFTAFAYGLAHVLGTPYRAAAAFERARQMYFQQRLATAAAKDEWLDYKAEKVAQQTQLRLRAVDVEWPRIEEEELPITPPDEST